MTVEPSATQPLAHRGSWVGFWLWALVGGGIVFGVLSFIVFVLLPMIVVAIVVARWSPWNDGASLVGLLAGAGLPLLVVAAVSWSAWNDRTLGDGTPNPYEWGAAGLVLLAAGVAASALLRRRNA